MKFPKLLRRAPRCRLGDHVGPFSEATVHLTQRGTAVPCIGQLRYCLSCGTVLVPESEIRELNSELAKVMRR